MFIDKDIIWSLTPDLYDLITTPDARYLIIPLDEADEGDEEQHRNPV